MATQSQLEQPLVKQLVEELTEGVPKMDPGTIFHLENPGRLGEPKNPFVAVLTCPRCGTPGLITQRQLYHGDMMICGGDICSAEFHRDGEIFIFRQPQ
jgi:hypothetical protein